MDTIIPMGTSTETGTATERPVRDYIGKVNRLFLSPSRFFREDLPKFSLSDALAFGIVSAWLASLISFAFETLNSIFLSRLFESWVQRLVATEEGFSFLGLSGASFLWSAGILVLGPFLFLLRIFLGSLALYFFSSLLIQDNELAPEPVTFKSTLRIEAAAFASYWFSVVPIFGTIIAFLANIVLLITGVRERYRVSTRRAAAVVLAPYFFLALTAFLFFLLFALLLMQLPIQDTFQLDIGDLLDLR